MIMESVEVAQPYFPILSPHTEDCQQSTAHYPPIEDYLLGITVVAQSTSNLTGRTRWTLTGRS